MNALRDRGFITRLADTRPRVIETEAIVRGGGGDVRAPSEGPLKPLRVLHVEDSQSDSELVMRELRRGGFDPNCVRVETKAAFEDALQTKEWDVIISDYSLPGYGGLAALADARTWGRDVPFILVSGTIGENGAVDVMRAGAQDYVLKDRLGRLPLAVDREMREARLRGAQRTMSQQLAISERMASAGMLAAGVAHEINNPLAVVMANLDFVTTILGRLAPDMRAFDEHRRELHGGAPLGRLEVQLQDVNEPLADASEAVERIRVIVRDVKLFARPQAEEREAVDVRSVIESSIRMAWNEIRHRAELVKDYGDVPMADSNEARLGQILLNVLVNAAQAMPAGDAKGNVIHVATKVAEDGRIVIEVRDTGSGMSKEVMARIFDPFFTTKPMDVGTGLGLSLCHRMVTDLGGEIAVESEVGKGTLFRITLPAAAVGARSAPKQRAAYVPVRRGRVLVVDDEAAIGRTLARSLGRHHDVTALTSGKEALALIASGERFDAILSDLMMPEVTGMQIYEELRRTASDQAKRMIFFTGGAFTAKAREFLVAVPNPRVEKPFEAANLLAIIAGMPGR